MFKSTKIALPFLFLLLAPLITANLTLVNAQSTTNQSSMIRGVLAHAIASPEAQSLAKSNITWVSCDVTFSHSDDAKWYQIYSLAKQNNLSVVGILDWHTMNYSQTFQLSDWGDAVNQAVNSFGDVVKTWEIWNEPNYAWNFFGYYNGAPSRYVALMQTAYSIIKTAQPASVVIGLGGMPLFTGAEPTPNDTYATQAYTWAQSVVQLGGLNYCDAIGIHAYPYGAYNIISQFAFQYFFQSYQQLCLGKPIWITEVGTESYSTNWTATESVQASFLDQSYTLLQNLGAKAYFWYELNDNYTERANSNFGLYDNNGNPKQAFSTFANLASPSSLPTPNPSTNPTASSSAQSPAPTASATASTSHIPTLKPTIPELSVVFVLSTIIAISTCAFLYKKTFKRNF